MSGERSELNMETKINNNPPKDQLESEIDATQPRIGVFICDCGSNIAGVIDVPSVVEFASGLTDVVFAEEGKWICAVDYLTKLKEHIIEHKLNRVVVACCTPRTHEPTFKETVREAGLNPYLLEFVSIREQSSWVHKTDPKKATQTAKDLVHMGVAKARYLEPGEPIRIPVGKRSLVIGGGISGITASLALGDLGFKVILVECQASLGGKLNRLFKIAPDDITSTELLRSKLDRVLNHENITVLTNTEVLDINGYVGNFKVKFQMTNTSNPNANQDRSDKYDNVYDISTIIVATGMEEIEPVGLFGYGKYPNVVTQLQFEEMLKNNDGRLSDLDNIAFINCVNSRNSTRGCCNVGCISSIKNIKILKKINHDANPYLFFRDFNITGTEVQYHYDSMDQYAASIRYPDKSPPRITACNSDPGQSAEKLTIQSYDIFTDAEISIDVDMVVLTTGYSGSTGSEKLKGLLKVSTNPDGFFTEAHVKLRPLDFANEGLFICGCARSPKSVKESIEESLGAAMRAAIPMEREFLETEGIVANVDPEACLSCGICTEACAFGAPELINQNIEIIKAICKGCGTCAASCPNEAIDIIHYSDEQILSQVDAALEQNPDEKLVVFACHWCALGAIDNAGVSRFEYPANIRVIRVLCSGRVDPRFIIHAFKRGAAGVLVAGCEIPTCHYISGNFYAIQKLAITKQLLNLIGVNPDRVRLEWLSAAQGARFAELATEFIAKLSELGKLDTDGFSELDIESAVECSNSIRLRLVASKLKLFGETGNVYGEIFTEYELKRLIEEIVFDEYLRAKIKLILQSSSSSISQISKDINIPSERILKTILDLKSNGSIEIEQIVEADPIYSLTESGDEIKIENVRIYTENNGNSTPFKIPDAAQDEQNFDFVIFGNNYSALLRTLEVAEGGKTVCLVLAETGFDDTSWILSEFYPDYELYEEKLIDLIHQVSLNKNISILRNAIIKNRIEEDDKTKLEILKKATFVDESKCNNCGKCLDICPVNILDHSHYCLSNKHAIYKPGPRDSEVVKFAISKAVPYCQASCPISMDVRGYIGKIADGKIHDSFEIIQKTNPIPDVCGKVCDHICESICARGFIDEPLAIRKLKRYATEKEYEIYKNHNRPLISKSSSLVNTDPLNKIAVIGSGPAGISAAHELAQMGYPVTIFEASSVLGGMLQVGIPDYRLPTGALQAEVDAILNLGVEVKLNSPIGSKNGTTINDLQQQGYKAIFIGIGAQKGLSLGLEDEDADGVLNGLKFLSIVNTQAVERYPKLGKNVAVIGGGNVAVDCARTARRMGAQNVTIYYRRSRSEMPANEDEINECLSEGISIEYLVSPKSIVSESMNSVKKLKAMEFIKTELGLPDASGRRRPVAVEGTEFTVNIDSLLLAIGQSPELEVVSDLASAGLDITKKSTIIIDLKTGATNVEGIFAGGDVVTGPANVVGAIKSGQRAALGISEYLSEPGSIAQTSSINSAQPKGEIRTMEMELIRLKKNKLIPNSCYEPEKPRLIQDLLDPKDRVSGFEEVEPILEDANAAYEATRCLSCRMCIGCGVCQSICPEGAVDYSQNDEFIIVTTDEFLKFPSIAEGRFNDRFELKELYRNNLNVLTLNELAYMLTPSSCYAGHIMRPVDGKIPISIAFLFLPEKEFVNDEQNCFDTLEFEQLIRIVKYLREIKSEIKISIFTNEPQLTNIPEQLEDWVGPRVEFNEVKEYFKIISKDSFQISSDASGCIEIEDSGNRTVFDLCVVNSGLSFSN